MWLIGGQAREKSASFRLIVELGFEGGSPDTAEGMTAPLFLVIGV